MKGMMRAVAEQAGLGFGGLLRQLRADAGLTQEELAEAASLSPRSVSDLERGINLTARKDTARLLADALGLTGPQRALFEAAARGRAPAADVLSAGGSVAIVANRFPSQLTPFVGRHDDVAAVRKVLAGARLVTLAGAGGIGKTRLALAAAAGLTELFPDGLWWVGLAPVSRGEQVLGALVQALGVREEEGAGLERALLARLQRRRMLVLLDNAEHLLPDLADVVVSLLAACDQLVVLATSRERLQLSAERVFAVPPLSAGDAVALLRERAAAAGVLVEPSPVVDRLCARLDRLPLALELAAARLRVFSPAQLLDRIGSRLDLFTGPRDAQPRHRTLRATIEWSHDLLTEPEQALFRRLAVFAGGCTLDAAESVCQPDPGALDGLLDKSLLQRGNDAPEPRFRMLESIGGFAAERLALAGEAPALRARHAGYFGRFANQMDAALRAGEPEEGPVAMLAADIGNLRAAVESGLDAGDTQLVREIIASLGMYWLVRGLHTEARSWMDRALALDDAQDRARQRLLSALATIAYVQGDHLVAVAASDEAASLAMQLGGVTERFEALDAKASAALMKGDLEAAEALLQDALDIALAVDNGVGISSCRLDLAWVAKRTGRYDRADEFLAENLPFVRAKGQTRCEGYTLASMADATVQRGRPGDCAADALLGARLAIQIGDRRLAVRCLELSAIAAAAGGDHRRAAAILAAGEAARREMGLEPDSGKDSIHGQALELLDQDGEDFTLGSAEGRSLDLPAALSLAAGEDLTPA
jgi:predicted ATPase/transcriptional regulator with XRE-family HTH domain